MYRIISQYSKYFLLNSLNYPIKIAVRLKRMFNMLWFEYLRIMVGNIYQMYYMKSHWWWFLLLYSNMSIAWLSESILAEKQFSSIRILSVTWISLRGTDKICLFTSVKLYEGQNLSLVSVSGTNGGQNQEKLMQCVIIPVCLMCWLSILSKLDRFFFYFLLHVV